MNPVEQNIQGVQQLVGSKVNKTPGALDHEEGVTGEKRDAFALDLSDEELIELSDRIASDYELYESKIKLRQEANLTFYLGRQKDGSALATNAQGISANILFEATETFLPAALSKNPEPVVWSDNTEEGNKLSSDVKTMLQYHADVLVLRRKLTLMVRKWAVDMLGVCKHGWDDEIKDIKTDVRDAKNFIFEKTGYVDSYGDFKGILGDRLS